MKKIITILFFLISLKQVYAQQYSVDIPNPASFCTPQRQSNWCWAACNQMLLNAQGIEQSQEDQVTKLFGQLIDRGAGGNYELARRALAGTYMVNGRTTRVIPYVSYLGQHSDDPYVIINHLNDGIPLVMATSMHGRVCVGVDYTKNGDHIQITNIRLYDPGRGGFITFTMQQFLNEGLIGFMTYKLE